MVDPCYLCQMRSISGLVATDFDNPLLIAQRILMASRRCATHNSHVSKLMQELVRLAVYHSPPQFYARAEKTDLDARRSLAMLTYDSAPSRW